MLKETLKANIYLFLSLEEAWGAREMDIDDLHITADTSRENCTVIATFESTLLQRNIISNINFCFLFYT